MRQARVGILLVPFALLILGAGPAAALECGDVGQLMRRYLQRHVEQHRLDAELEERTVETYLDRIDAQRTLLDQKEAGAFRKSLKGIFEELIEPDCAKLHQLHLRITEKLQSEERFVRTTLGAESYAVDPSAELILDPETRGRPKDPEARLSLLRTLVDFQISNYLNADTGLAESKERLVHRYELRTRRWAQISRRELYSGFLNAYANALDPHSSYLSQDDLEDFQIGMRLSLEGIGVALSERDGFAVVEQVIPGGAADQLDVLQPKDKIIGVSPKADDEFVDVIDMRLRDIVRLIRGQKGTRVGLSVLRQGETTERFQVEIVRDKINLEQQAAKLTFEETEVQGRKLKLAILDLPSFYGDREPGTRQGSRDVAAALRQVEAEGADGLLLDLSRNGGGLLEDAVKISGFFVTDGGIVAIQGTNERSRVLRDPDDGILYSGPLVVHTSRVSASASEILAGALKDYDRAVIVGDDHTFGKGTVQSVFPLGPGLGALKVTTALFFRPGGHSTQHTGVDADVVLPSPFATDQFGERNQPYSLPGRSVEPFLGAGAHGTPPRFTPVTPEILSALQARSAARVGDSEAFQTIVSDLEKREEDDGVIALEELFDDEQSPEKGSENGDGSEESTESEVVSEDQPRTPQLDEALRVLADLVVLQS